MKILLAAAALGLIALAASPAAAFDPIYNSPYNSNNWTTYGVQVGPGWGWDNGYRQRSAYGYGYGDPAWESGASQIAVCPPGYHLGRQARLCWPD